MTCRLAAFSLMGALAACHPPAPEKGPLPVQVMAVEAAPVVSAREIRERSERCAKASSERFHRESKQSGAPLAGWTTAADFASHYNAKMNVCFYLLTVRHYTITEGEFVALSGTLRKVLYDFGTEEQYGEYLGPAVAGTPWKRLDAKCKIEELFCFSEDEWNTIARTYMED